MTRQWFLFAARRLFEEFSVLVKARSSNYNAKRPQRHPKPLSDHPVWSFTVVRILVKVTSALSIIHFLYVVLMENSSNNVWLLKWLLFVWKALELTLGILCDILNDCSKTLNLNHRDRVNYFQTKEFSNFDSNFYQCYLHTRKTQRHMKTIPLKQKLRWLLSHPW